MSVFIATGRFCPEHGGNCDPRDAWWLCDMCARQGVKQCKCGGPARVFGEALFAIVGCEWCNESVSTVGTGFPSVRTLWNMGVRGHL